MYTCDKCNKEFVKPAQYANHRGICGQTNVFKCCNCEKEFDTRSSYAGHKSHCGKIRTCNFNLRKDRPIVEKKCRFCNTKFSRQREVRYHENHCERNPDREQKYHLCKFCGKEFETGRKLGSHTTLCKLNPDREETINAMIKTHCGAKHTEETKQKIRKSFIYFIEKSPDKHAWTLKNKTGFSYPEQIFNDQITKAGWYQKYEIDPEHFLKGYWIDFAFVKEKVAIEIDGSQHQTTKAIQHDKKRNETMLNLGWRIYRVSANLVTTKTFDIINDISSFLRDPKIKFKSVYQCLNARLIQLAE